MPPNKRPVLKTGELAYWDSVRGMVPCKVTKITGKSGPAGSDQQVYAKLTAARSPYKRGELVSGWGLHFVPRAAYFRRRLGSRIGYYTVTVDRVST